MGPASVVAGSPAGGAATAGDPQRRDPTDRYYQIAARNPAEGPGNELAPGIRGRDGGQGTLAGFEVPNRQARPGSLLRPSPGAAL